MTAFMDELDALVGDDYMAHDPKVSAIKKLVERHYGGRESAEIEFDREFTVRGIDRWWCHGCGESIDVRGGMPAPCFCPWCGAERKAEPPEVLDADGVPIRVRDTVYADDGTKLEVMEVDNGEWEYGETPVWCGERKMYGKNCSVRVHRLANQLTHTPPDSREKVRGDMMSESFMKIVQAGEGVRGLEFHVDDYLARIDALVAAGRWSE